MKAKKLPTTNISFESDAIPFTINNNKEKIIYLNPTDTNIVTRYRDADKAIKAKVDALDIEIAPDGTANTDNETAIQALKDLDCFIKKQIDYIFDADVSAVVFGQQSCLSLRGGRPMYERFLEAAIDVLTKHMEHQAELGQDRIRKYTSATKSYRGK